MVQTQRGGPSETIHPRYHRDVPWQQPLVETFLPSPRGGLRRKDRSGVVTARANAPERIDRRRRAEAPSGPTLRSRQIESRYTRLTAVASAEAASPPRGRESHPSLSSRIA